jgi:hypothetical protein
MAVQKQAVLELVKAHRGPSGRGAIGGRGVGPCGSGAIELSPNVRIDVA